MVQKLSSQKVKSGLGMIMFLYMLGIFMGAIDTGIVTPARTVIQAGLGVGDKTGIWMITIFTLAYAASIPIAGKVADRIGRKHVYIVCIALFGIGSLICGLSSNFSSFSMLLTGRVIQAIGGGGIMPIASAEFGTTFPEEKRGMVLGLLGGVYGLANILGSSFGSAILDIFGIENWQFLFYINLPIAVVIIIMGSIFLPVNKSSTAPKKIDTLGTVIIVGMILSLIYGLRNIDFFNFTESIKSNLVYPFLIVFLVLLPIFIMIEKRAEDPILNLSYFTTPRILITLIVGFFVGICMMGMIFVPQFSENSLRIATGKGGYFVTILGVFTAIGAPMSGKLVDKYGAKKILIGGFFVSLLGSVFLAFVAVQVSNLLTVLISLALIGTGLGFVMGSPLNYMMLGNTKKEQANSALATLSLVRSIGTVIAPSIMIGFLAQAGISAQTNLMNMLPQPTVPVISQAVQVNETFTKMKSDPRMAEMLKGVDIPNLSKMGEMKIDMSSGKPLPDDILKLMQTADITNIVDRTKQFSVAMSKDNLPAVITKIQTGIDNGIVGMNAGITGIDAGISQIKAGVNGMDPTKSAGVIAAMQQQKETLAQTIDKMKELKDIVPSAFDQSQKDYLKSIDNMNSEIEDSFQSTLGTGFKQMFITVAIFCVISILFMALYSEPKKQITK